MTTSLRKLSGITALSQLLLCLFFGLTAGCASNRPTNTGAQDLQGQWEGFAMNRESPTGPYVKTDQKVSIAIKGNSLIFNGGPDFVWETTFTLPAATDPKQLHATIQNPKDHSGDLVIAFYTLEDGTLTLGGIRAHDSEDPWPTSFEETVDRATGRYALQRVPPK